MTEGKYRTHEICQFDYSDIWEKSFDERYTDTPLRNDEIIKLLNEQEELISYLRKELIKYKPNIFDNVGNYYNDIIYTYKGPMPDVRY